METIKKNTLLYEIKPYIKEMVVDIVAESFRKGEMKEIFEDLFLAKSMEKVEDEDDLSYEEALQQIEWK